MNEASQILVLAIVTVLAVKVAVLTAATKVIIAVVLVVDFVILAAAYRR